MYPLEDWGFLLLKIIIQQIHDNYYDLFLLGII